jgi:TPR repeat protein
MARGSAILIMAGMAALMGAVPAHASVKDGVDAWDRGDWSAAVADWRGAAEAGDPDAMFNMGQAFRLGRGVPKDEDKALDYYARAARLGHVRASDTYGILLFQDGKRKEAMPYIESSARRGDPRAQYLLGISLFNGDIMPKDWVRAYALLTLANSEGLPQAAPALAQMDGYIPLEQRQQAATLAVQLKKDADAARTRESAAVDLADSGRPIAEPAPAAPAASQRVPQPVRSVDLEPSVAAARQAVQEAMLATGTENPAQAGADFARPATVPAPPSANPAPSRQAANTPPPQPPAQYNAPPVARSVPAPAATGAWKLQLGVFSVSGNAERLWSQLAGLPELAGKNRLLVPAGRLTKLLAGGYASQSEASAACQGLKRAGQDCLVTR